jgi:3-oxoacyl-[acyl-carrier-protein] synthase-3
MPAIRPGAKGAVISGWGTALPEKVITNDELAATMDTSDEWIRTRTGIEERRVGGSTAGLSVESGRRALEMAGLEPHRIDALVLSTTTPDKQWGTSAQVQHELGLSCGAFDINAACSGFVYGLVLAHGLVAMGADRVLLIGTDTVSRITDWDDRSTAPLFADGSGAVVIESVDGGGQMLGWDPMPTDRCSRSCGARSAAPSAWKARRCSGGPSDSWSTQRRRPCTTPA